MSYLMLMALATLIYAGAWMAAAPSKALSAVKVFSTQVNRFDTTTQLPGIEEIPESTSVLLAFRFLGLGLILLSLIRLIELT
jgi:hypothetical protein